MARLANCAFIALVKVVSLSYFLSLLELDNPMLVLVRDYGKM